MPLGEDRQEDMLGGNIFVLETVGFLVRRVNNSLYTRGDEDLSCAASEDIGFGAGA